MVSTDDAYVQAHSVLISPKVSGYISEVPVDDNQSVQADEILARIDPRDYQTALDQARANVAAAQASIDTLNQQIVQQKLVVEQDRQQVASDQAALVFSQQDYQRYTELAKTGFGTVQRAQQAAADIREKEAALQHDDAVVAAARKQIGVYEAQLAQAKAALAQQQAMEHQAELNLGYTTITAPVQRHRRRADGAGRGIRPGRHTADGGRAAAGGLCRGELQGDGADRRAARPKGHN
jgi:membrane fusion protein (multidrug efflux system)